MSSPAHTCGCAHANPIEVLKVEHRVIERVLGALERLAAQSPLDFARLRMALDFLRNFTDGCHHAKEENELFPRMQAAGVPRDGGPIACMLDEHVQGRALVRTMSSALDDAATGVPEALLAFRSAVAQYVTLLRNHIWKEDHVVFELAGRIVEGCERDALARGFERTEASERNAGKHEQYLRLADELERATLAGSTDNVPGGVQ